MDKSYYRFVQRLDDNHRKVTEHGKFGIVDDSGMILAPIRYDDIIERADGNYDICINNRWGIINVEGEELVSAYYKNPIQFNDKGYAIVQNADDSSYGLIRNDYIIAVPAKYSSISEAKVDTYFDHYEFDAPLFFVQQTLKETDWYDDMDYRIGVCNLNGDFVVPIRYEGIKIKESFLLAKRKGYFDLYDGLNNRGLLIGGFHQFDINKNRLFFYFGGHYTSYTDKHDEDHVSFVAWDGVWIITDFEMTSILKDDKESYRNLKGKIYDISTHDSNDLRKIYEIFPKCMTFIENSEWPHLIGSFILVRDWDSILHTDYYIIDQETGEKSDKYHEIKDTGIENLFFVEKTYGDDSSGILRGTKLVIPTVYLAFTKPVNGFSFGAKKVDEDKYSIELINLNKIEDVRIAYTNLSHDEVLGLFWNQNLLIDPINDEEGMKGIRIIKSIKLEKDFEKAISSEESVGSYRYYSNWKDRYWFPDHYYMKENKAEETEDEDLEDEEENNDDNMSLHDYLHQWDQYSDIAYEGYSRLYLGLED